MINGRYHLHEKLGQGGMGIVHRATDRLTGEIVALKQVFLPVEQLMFHSRPATHTNAALRLALAHEFQTLAGLRHPNIISVLDYGFDEDRQPFFTMTYLENAQTILAARNCRSVPEKVTLLIQMLEALAYLHRRGILHRDLKPDNVLVVGDTVRVLDFGLAAAKEQATDSVGSWLYIAPEVLLGQPATEASDLYTVGVLAYQLFAGEHPIDRYAADVIGEILEGEPDWRKLGVGEGLTAVVRTLLAKEPDERYPTANHAIIAFYDALGQSVPQETAVIRESYLQAATFVGRDEEMTQLNQALTQGQAGQGGVWLVGGESGVGKSRLIEEFRTQALVEGWDVIRGQAITGGMPFQLWQNIIYRLALTVELTPLEAGVLHIIAPQLDSLLGQEIQPPPTLEDKATQQRLISTLVDILCRQEQPTLLILEDLHWAHDSLSPLVTLLRVIQKHRLIVVGTYRDDEQPHLAEKLSGAQLIKLNRLDSEAITELSQSILGSQIGDHADMVKRLADETEGNAFFLVEIIRALAEEAGQLADVGSIVWPEQLLTGGIQQIVQRRLDKVPAVYLPLLKAAAILGRSLNLQFLQYFIDSRQLEAEIDGLLLAGQDASVLVVFEDKWRFAHDKLRETLLATLTADERPQLFRRVAEAIEHLYPEDPNWAEALTSYWGEVGDQEKQQRYAWQAGKYLAERYVNEEALRFLTLAYQSTPETAYQQQFDILLTRLRTNSVLGNMVAQREDIALLQALADQDHLSLRQQVELRLQIADFNTHRANDFAKAIETLQEALAYANELEDASLQGELHELWGDALHKQGNVPLALAQYEKAFAYLDGKQHLVQRARLLGNLIFILSVEGLYEDCVPYYQEAIQLYNQISDKRMQASLSNIIAIHLSIRGDHGKALAHFLDYSKLCERTGDRYGKATALGNIGLIYHKLGDFQAAEQMTAQDLEIQREMSVAYGISNTLSNLSSIRCWLGEYEKALANVQEAIEITRRIGSHYLVEQLVVLGFVQAQLKHFAEANQAFAEGLEMAQASDNFGLICDYQAHWAACQQQQGNSVEAMKLVEATLPHLEKSIFTADQPFLIYWHCYQILLAQADERANSVLEAAYHRLLKVADKISESNFRRSFLENVPHHRQIVEAYETTNNKSCFQFIGQRKR